MTWLDAHTGLTLAFLNSAVLLVLSIVTDRGFASIDRRITRIEIELFDLRSERNTSQ